MYPDVVEFFEERKAEVDIQGGQYGEGIKGQGYDSRIRKAEDLHPDHREKRDRITGGSISCKDSLL